MGAFFVITWVLMVGLAAVFDWRLNKIAVEAKRTNQLLEESLVRLGEIVGESRQGRRATDKLLDAVTGK